MNWGGGIIMKIVPVQGLILNEPEHLDVVIQAHTGEEIAMIMQVSIPNDSFKKKVFLDTVYFVKYSELRKFSPIEYEKIIAQFPNTKTFALIECRYNKWAEIYYLKISLSIIYIAKRWKNEIDSDFFDQSRTMNAYFTRDGLKSTIWDVTLGSRELDSNDFDLTIPCYYTIDDLPDTYRLPVHRYHTLKIDSSIQTEIEKMSTVLIKNSRISSKLKSALNLLYTTFSFSNLDLIIPTYGTILETLLLENNEENQRKKVAVRAACLIQDKQSIGKKRYISNWIYYFYKYRNMIVHDGKSHLHIRVEEEVIFNNAVNLIQHVIYSLIKIYADSNIENINQVKDIVNKNKSADGFSSAFEYIDEKLCMYYEE